MLVGYQVLKTIVSTKPTTTFIILGIVTLFFISFVISLDIQEKRQKLPLEQLPKHQISKNPQRRGTLFTVVLVILGVITYFLIGKQSQQPPEIIPDSYFETTWLDPNLPDEENGYIQF